MLETIERMTIGIAVLLAVAGAVQDWTQNAQAVEPDYYATTQTGAELEAKYTAMGEYDVSYKEYKSENLLVGKHEIWYPTELETAQDGSRWPVVVMANGTGVAASRYVAIFKHLASWGFVVVGNEQQNSWDGSASAESLDLLIALNEDESSVFYHKLDTDNAGSVGHSQGGIGAINAVTEQDNGVCYKALCTISAPSSLYASTLNWPYDVSKIDIPYFMVAGTLLLDAGTTDDPEWDVDAEGISPLWSQEENYGLLPDTTPKLRARRAETDHEAALPCSDGYVTAWFMYWLKGDAEAGRIFFGPDAELLSNPNWQDIEKNL